MALHKRSPRHGRHWAGGGREEEGRPECDPEQVDTVADMRNTHFKKVSAGLGRGEGGMRNPSKRGK